MIIRLPYGHGWIEYDAPSTAAVLESSVGELRGGGDGRKIVEAAMERPVGTPRLKELAKGKKTCTLIISDHTRPVPSKDILPPMLKELREGSPGIDITLLVATGFHRSSSKEELVNKLGREIFENETIVVHDCADPASNTRLGLLPSGAPLVIDTLAAETDLLVAEGFIEPHFFAGFSGGRKSVLPGVCDRVTVLGNHCSAFIDSPFARTGILDGNPLHRDMLAAGRMAKLAFIVNVIIDEEKKTVAAFAGDFETAHRAGCDFLRRYCTVKPAYADIAITTNGGAPLDQNIYQCVKSMTAAEATAAPGGVIVLCAECADGTGGDGFYRSLKDCRSPEQLYESIMATPQQETIPDQWETQILARILKKHRVIFVTRPELERTVSDMKMIYAPSLEKALELARGYQGKDASVTVIPNGIAVIVDGDGE
ncbi:Nickel-dependent lactate racemase [Papillibacter cinnamivorans DSM 12816]|uniref:Nickel-dependent lactate racemase n=2 Tax=Papillibacter TaxID=100175 RepID=A0A1W2C069_9FIRM|nr:nickel-dependent lactate racemase [Papillibacter cinnamivorans]SMC78491.1 Nickel-dependent lactate racemase [Papillibacter cinnamivorans DSM 12816]